MSVLIFVLGVVFGFALSRGGASDFDFIQRMFLLESFQLYGIIGTAVAVALPGLWWLKRRGKTAAGQAIHLTDKPRHGGTVLGGALFGVGWAMTGMCPGPIFVNLGEGKLYALAAIAGALTGAWLLGVQYPRLQKALNLPELVKGTGAG
jgi:uncharacterized membrane protein YedE/YeeE